jgi:large subunit ribosomal protein L22
MEAQATARYVRMGPRKVRFVLDTVRGKYAADALDILKFTPNHAAAEISKVLRSAMANAGNNHGLDLTNLKIARCYVDVGPTMKRVQPRAQGRAYRILKRSSHITIVVAEGAPKPIKTGKKAPKAPLRAELKVEPVVVEEIVETVAVDATESVEASVDTTVEEQA